MRVARSLPRKTIAAETGMNVSYLAALERGSRNPPSPKKLERLLDLVTTGPKEREQLQLAAYLARLPSEDEEAVPPSVRGTMQIIKAIAQLTTDEIRMIKTVIEAVVANHIFMETDM